MTVKVSDPDAPTVSDDVPAIETLRSAPGGSGADVTETIADDASFPPAGSASAPSTVEAIVALPRERARRRNVFVADPPTATPPNEQTMVVVPEHEAGALTSSIAAGSVVVVATPVAALGPAFWTDSP